jgi:uncharacterized membrane protein
MLGEDREGFDKFVNNIKKAFMEDKNVKISEYIAAIIFSLLFLYIVNNLLNWNISFISESFNQVLWAINLSILVTIIGNILLIIYHSSWFIHSIKAIINFFSLIATYIFYSVYPLIISQSYINVALKIILILIIIGTVISIIYHIFRIIYGAYNKS